MNAPTHGLRRAIAGLALVFAVAASNAADLDVGRRVFETTCAACHGAKGRPDPASPVVQALGVEPADLSDPLFNSREPASDWIIVARDGGHALGLSEQMPAWGQALTEEEIASVVAYAKTLAPGSDQYPPGEFNLMLPVRTQKAFPEDEVVWKSRYSDEAGKDVWRNVLEIEKRFGKRGQASLELVEEEGNLHEVEVGWKHALSWSLERGYLLSGGAKVALPTEGDGSEELIPFLAWAQEISPRATFQSSARAVLPFDDVDAGELEVSGVVHYTWSERPQSVFPALEATAQVPFEDDGGDRVKFTLVPQLRFGLTRGGHVALNLGAEIPLSDQAYDWRVHLTFLWDFADGSFFQGWGK